MSSPVEDLRGSVRRLIALERAGLSGGVDPEAYDRLTDLARQITGAVAAFISILEVDCDRYLSQSGLPEPLATTRELRGDTFCGLALGRSTPLVIDDTSADAAYASVPTVAQFGVAAYLSAPIRSVEGEALGSFCLIDSVPRSWTPVEIELVVQLALATEREIAMRHPETGRAAAVQNQALMRVAGALAHVGGWAVDLSDNSLYWSDEIHEILETRLAPGVLDAGLDMYPPGERERIEAAFAACATDGVAYDLELVIRTGTGKLLEVRAVGEPEYDDAGRIVRVFGAFQDISGQSAQVRETKELADRLVDTLESISDAFFSLDTEWRFTYLNKHAEAMTKRDRAALLGKAIWDGYSTEKAAPFLTTYQQAVETGEPQVATEYYEPLDAWIEASAYPSAQGLSVYFRDVTEERRVQARLAERDKLLREQGRLLDASHDAIIVRDLDGRIRYWNDGAARLYGWSQEEAVGQRVGDLIYADPSDLVAAQLVLESTGTFIGELQHVTRSGDRRVVLARWTAVRSEDGAEVSVMAINTDVTAARQMEEQFLRAQRLESIGTLAGGIAHDMNNVLAPIMLAVELLRDGVDDADHEAILNSVHSSALRGSKLIQQVLLFARGAEGQRVALAVDDLLESTAGIVNGTFPKSIEFRVGAADGARERMVLAEPTQLQQVLLNLCVNARDAVSDGGTITLDADIVEIDAQYAALTPDAVVGTYVAFRVEDDGDGMSAEVLDRCFEPFFTTKEHGHGTGLGLSTSLAIAKSHGGFMRAYSEVGRGTTFRLYLPLATGRATDGSGAASEQIVRGSGELILLVDDESAVLEVTAQTLRAFGYRVLTAVDGAEAVALFAQRHQEIDLVLTDMMMPVMDGPGTVQVVKRIRPDVPIVAASGLDTNGQTAKVVDLGVRHFLSKPYTAQHLLRVVRAALDEASTGAISQGPV